MTCRRVLAMTAAVAIGIGFVAATSTDVPVRRQAQYAQETTGGGGESRREVGDTPATVPPSGPPTSSNPPALPYDHVILALGHLQTVDPEERIYTRYLSLYDSAESELADDTRFLSWWVHNMSFEAAISLPKAVEGSRGRLFAVNLVDYRWNPEAWEAVARRDPRFREPWMPSQVAVSLRDLIGAAHVSQEKTATRPLVAILSAKWFLRETIETNRSPSYYDLLFAQQRFKDGGQRDVVVEEIEEYYTEEVKEWPGGAWTDPRTGNTTQLARGRYRFPLKQQRVREVKLKAPAAKFKDFPADQVDWEKAFGVDVAKAAAKSAKLDIDFGAIVAGKTDDPVNGSIVTLSNRLIVTLHGPFGAYMETYDVKRTSKERDFLQQLIFGGQRFAKGAGAQAIRDAGELLAYLPNGGQAALLVNGQGKRIEVAGGEFATDTADPERQNPGVRNPGSCVTCHAGANGFIPPRDLYAETLGSGVKAKTPKDSDKLNKQEQKELLNRIDGFFLNWQERIQGWATPYDGLLKRTTTTSGKAWTGAQAGDYVLRFRARYDKPVDLKQAAIELGMPENGLKYLLSRSPNVQPLRLLRGVAIPRSVFDDDVIPEVGTLLSAYRKDAMFEKILVEERK